MGEGDECVGVSDLPHKAFFFFPLAHKLRMLKEALQAQNSLIHLLEAAIHLLEYEACGRGEGEEWAWGEIAEKQLEPDDKNQARQCRLICAFFMNNNNNKHFLLKLAQVFY